MKQDSFYLKDISLVNVLLVLKLFIHKKNCVLHEHFSFDCRVYQKHLFIIAHRYQAHKLFGSKLSYLYMHIQYQTNK
jgi:hypothetical protein